MKTMLESLLVIVFLNGVIPLLYQWQMVQRSSNPKVREMYASLSVWHKLTFGAVRDKLPAFRGLFVLMRISTLIGAVCAVALLVLFFAAPAGVFLLYTRKLCLLCAVTAGCRPCGVFGAAPRNIGIERTRAFSSYAQFNLSLPSGRDVAQRQRGLE